MYIIIVGGGGGGGGGSGGGDGPIRSVRLSCWRGETRQGRWAGEACQHDSASSLQTPCIKPVFPLSQRGGVIRF